MPGGSLAGKNRSPLLLPSEHLAHLLALAIERELTVSEMLAMPFYHPVVEEGLRGVLRQLQKDLPVATGSDLSGCESIGHEALD